MGINRFGELIIYHCWCAFDPDCEVLEESNPLPNNTSTNRRGIGKYNPKDFINNHYYSTFKDHHFLGTGWIGHNWELPVSY